MQKSLSRYFEICSPLRKRIKVSSPVKIADGWETDVYSFILEYESNGRIYSDDLVLRVYPGENAGKKAAREFYAMFKLREVGFPVPKVYYLMKDGSCLGRPFVIMEKINGQSMGEILEKSSESKRKRILGLFCRMFVDLHKLDVSPFTSDPMLFQDLANHNLENPYGYLDRLFAGFRSHLQMIHTETDEHASTLFSRIMDWLEKQKHKAPVTRLSLVHLDYHPNNILIRDDMTASVIDWTNFDITDYRVDLAWTLLLTGTYRTPKMRDCILSTYERLAGSKVENIEYFEAIAATRRLGSIYLSLTKGAEKLGMRQETANIMRKETNHIKSVIKVLSERTGFAAKEFDGLFKF